MGPGHQGFGLHARKLKILFASQTEDPEVWLPRLRHALPQERFTTFPENDADVALVASAAPGT